MGGVIWCGWVRSRSWQATDVGWVILRGEPLAWAGLSGVALVPTSALNEVTLGETSVFENESLTP